MRTVVEECQRVRGLWGDEPLLVGAYVFGAVLEPRSDVPVVQMAFALNLPADELTWCVQPQSCVGLPGLLEIDKEDLRMPAPTDAEQHEQLTVELAASLAHLRRVDANYWERGWRPAHRGFGIYPENHLWDAVHGYLDLLAATSPR
ncbi:hypothetical protein Dfulv_00885 [Dactylosporangium fulvum]|uniref:DUF7711 domain-containing protein n=1 Tax=Dactylosporangium fulvum TaxID=53359 RepID=A0ABY5W484_9ACTN|nr:hypothetical protein [Dactylosporangium fulvum]UWP82901.1 hypothetical protein Dfulv_00885 [Dactylosporangium fulvum]